MKPCSACGETKPLTAFYWTTRRNGDRAKHSKCTDCRKAQFKVWSSTPNGKRVKRGGILRRRYGLTEEGYNMMFAAQKGVCLICERPETRQHKGGKLFDLSVDHDHATGAHRALLCSACNVGLGSFRDDAALLRAAARYLTGYAAKAVV